MTDLADHALLLSLGLLFAALTAVVTLIGGNALRRLVERRQEKSAGEDEAMLLRYVVERNASLLENMKPNAALRERLVRLAASLEGEPKARLANAYLALGYADEDFRAMRGKDLTATTRAMRRCRTLMLRLPDALWLQLLEHDSASVRWGAMESFILARGKKSFLTLMWFLRHPRNRSRGMALHLSTCFAKVAPTLLPRIIDFLDDDFTKGTWLHALAVRPVPGSERALLPLAASLEKSPLFPAAVRAIGALPSPDTLVYLVRLTSHPNAEARGAVAEAMASFQEPAAIYALSELAADEDPDVCAQAVKSLLALEPLSSHVLRHIAAEEDHPSRTLALRAHIGGAA